MGLIHTESILTWLVSASFRAPIGRTFPSGSTFPGREPLRSAQLDLSLTCLFQPSAFQTWWAPDYPLVNVYITIKNCHFQWVNQLFLWPFSIAMLNYSIVKVDGANFWNAPSIDHLGDGIFCAIYRFPTHAVKNNLCSSSLVKFISKIAMNLGYMFFWKP